MLAKAGLFQSRDAQQMVIECELSGLVESSAFICPKASTAAVLKQVGKIIIIGKRGEKRRRNVSKAYLHNRLSRPRDGVRGRIECMDRFNSHWEERRRRKNRARESGKTRTRCAGGPSFRTSQSLSVLQTLTTTIPSNTNCKSRTLPRVLSALTFFCAARILFTLYLTIHHVFPFRWPAQDVLGAEACCRRDRSRDDLRHVHSVSALYLFDMSCQELAGFGRMAISCYSDLYVANADA